MKIVLRVWLIFLFVMFACLSPVLAMTKSYNGTGGGPTERAAIQDAFRKILENAQGIDVESNSYLTNSTLTVKIDVSKMQIFYFGLRLVAGQTFVIIG